MLNLVSSVFSVFGRTLDCSLVRDVYDFCLPRAVQSGVGSSPDCRLALYKAAMSFVHTCHSVECRPILLHIFRTAQFTEQCHSVYVRQCVWELETVHSRVIPSSKPHDLSVPTVASSKMDSIRESHNLESEGGSLDSPVGEVSGDIPVVCTETRSSKVAKLEEECVFDIPLDVMLEVERNEQEEVDKSDENDFDLLEDQNVADLPEDIKLMLSTFVPDGPDV
ncbi:uncharacterized protein LOC115228359 [Octopus sinensis]|uniref:Uncharacterized protein LOC115228359 n=1 Tax=Octopus sinensis TaxID=2607531 RepID=A0A6P7TRG0_9MOLL|nr:uncharacterized protein LOC115228359 [Octopus sinensis]